ncbi:MULTISPECIES: nucleoside/nucleotide kinase family protein [Paraburkholderia]|uniref:nucleoside/nucleotide kinase family protein n=1 Tax=Paraburkholderia TaxID=1822464 RepID=UPI0022504010|nr:MULTISPECIES: nucleoside/nucleotide kinase family protein [Paraburkholderia]MCX4160023.1 nucleoside/nucleotide kinase family protein [Paraburkholderia megapolitana]MDN7155523.1 nucleoside/nucleotide kinase family protein [Paraburkholderia sp. CHISQ3]MDQ6492567.1 nucleoside/nucleotide kinase family protein [Paraburkholderia megapolitana]
MIEDRFIARLEQLIAHGKRRILGLVGAPGAGKSTVAQAILEAFPDRAVIVPMDGFHLANVELERLGRAARKGAEDTFDSAGYVALLGRLRAQRSDEVIYAPTFRREIEEPIAGAIPVMPDTPLVITEGNYLLLDRGHWKDVRPLLDEAWYVDVDPELRRQRLVERHMRFGRDEVAARNWVQHTDEVNAVLIESTRARADLVFPLA